MDLILKQYNIIKTHGTSQRPGPLALDLLWPIHYFLKNNAGPNHHIHWCRTCSSQSHVHKHNNSGPCLQCSCHGSGHFQLNVINKPIRIQASQAAGLDLINAITCSLTKQYTSIPSDPWALNLLMSNNNFMKKTMHIPSSRSTGPALVRSLLLEQNSVRPSLHIHWRRTCSFPITCS